MNFESLKYFVCLREKRRKSGKKGVISHCLAVLQGLTGMQAESRGRESSLSHLYLSLAFE